MPIKHRYKKADTHIIFNEDQDLTTMKVKLPKQPSDPTQIIGYGLPRDEQKFIRPEIPKKLIELNKNKKLTIEEKSKVIRDDPKYYAEEVEFIQKEWEKRKNGVWYYINGKPTYITGVFYFYLTAWYVGNKGRADGLPDYRDRDRKFFIFVDFVENDPNCFGLIYPKHRREGATSKAGCWHYEYISRRKDVKGGIQSKSEDDAKLVFTDHIVKAWRKMPFWYLPIFEGSTNPQSKLSFNAPAIKVTASNMGGGEKEAIESSIDFKASGEIAYDGDKLNRYHADEIGKTKLVDIYERHLVARECLSQRNTIIGKCIYTSTAGEMTKGGGAQFKKLIVSSDPAIRDGNGRTTSGLYPLFIPATEGFIMDEFGASLEKESLEFLQNERKQAVETEDYEKLNKSTRQYPIRLRDCFRNASKTNNFNMKIIEDQLDKYQFGNTDVTVGDFEWENNIPDSRVIFTPKENGKFMVSYLFHNPQESNRFFISNGRKIPANDKKFLAGGDTFKFNKTQGGNSSFGGGAVFMKRDFSIDKDDTPIEEWETHRFVCTYLYRPKTKEIFCEDMLMMSIYYGCRMCPEINVPSIMDHFELRDYPGYLHYVLNKKTKKYMVNPGYNTQTKEKDSIFKAYHSYVEMHGRRLVHHDLLEQLQAIDDDMGDYDLFAAGGMCLIGSEDEQNFNKPEDEKKGKGTNLSGYYRQRSY